MRIPIGPTADAFTECNEKGKSGSSVYNALNTAVERLLKSADVDNRHFRLRRKSYNG